jgi:short-subunit dehydrogenase
MAHLDPSALPWSRAVIVGASTGIGAALARRLGHAGTRLALVARRGPLLEALADEIAAAGAPRPLVLAHDVTDGAAVPPLLEQLCRDLEGLDLFVYAAGIMPRIDESTYDTALDRGVVEVNLLGAMAWINAVAPRFERAGCGTIVALSSVAGDRGRRGYPAYNASKAALSTYLEAIRNRVARAGVTVVTVKPGPVQTPMTDGMARLPFLIPADEAARIVLDAAARGRHEVYVPWRWRPIMLAIRAIPSRLFRRLDL